MATKKKTRQTYDPALRYKLANRVIKGEKISAVSEQHGISEGALRIWVQRVRDGLLTAPAPAPAQTIRLRVPPGSIGNGIRFGNEIAPPAHVTDGLTVATTVERPAAAVPAERPAASATPAPSTLRQMLQGEIAALERKLATRRRVLSELDAE